MGPLIRQPEDIVSLTKEWGFLPFFRNEVPGFSIEEHTPEHLWFSKEQDGPWEWKGPAIESGEVAYGKFFLRKAGFVSLDLLGDFASLRRRLFPVREASAEQRILDLLTEHESLLSKELKRLSGFTAQGAQTGHSPLERLAGHSLNVSSRLKSAFEQSVTSLEMGVHVVTETFEYNLDSRGEPYGWGVARYCIPERLYAFFPEYSQGLDEIRRSLLQRPSSHFKGWERELGRLIG